MPFERVCEVGVAAQSLDPCLRRLAAVPVHEEVPSHAVDLPDAVAVRLHEVASPLRTTRRRPPQRQLAGVGPACLVHQRREDPVDADYAPQRRRAGEHEGAVLLPKLLRLDAPLGGHHLGAEAVEHVVVRSGALRDEGSEALDNSKLVQLRQTVPGGRGRVEERVGELVAGEDSVVGEHVEDRAVPLGESTGDIEHEVVVEGGTGGLGEGPPGVGLSICRGSRPVDLRLRGCRASATHAPPPTC